MDINFTMGDSKLTEKEEKKDADKAIEEVIDFFGKDIVEIK